MGIMIGLAIVAIPSSAQPVLSGGLRLPSGCSTNDLPKWTGSTWACSGGPAVTGSGSSGRSTRWASSSSIGNGAWTDDGTNATSQGTVTSTGAFTTGTSSSLVGATIWGPSSVRNLASTGIPTSLAGGAAGTFYVVSPSGNYGIVSARATNDANGAHIALYKTRSTDASVKTAVVNADTIGGLDFQAASDSSTVVSPSSLYAVVDGAVSAGVVPTSLRLFTGSTSPILALNLDSSQNATFYAAVTATGLLTATAGGTTPANWTTTGTGDLVSADDLTVGDDATITDTLSCTGDFAVNTNKFNVTASSGNTTVAGTLASTGAITDGGNRVFSVAGAGLTSTTSSVDVVAASGGGLVVNANDVGMITTCNTGERLAYEGGSWVCRQIQNDYSAKHYEWNDEYTMLNCANTGQCGSFFTARVSGASAACTGIGIVANSNRPGMMEFLTGSTNTGLAALTTVANMLDFAATTSVSFEATVGWPTLSTSGEGYASVVGFADSFNLIDFADGCYFLYDERNAAATGSNTSNLNKLSCWCAKGSNRTKFLMDGSTVSDGSFTTVDAPVAAAVLPDTNMYRLKITFDGTTAKFYRNGVDSCHITTNVPNSSAYTGVQLNMLKSVGGTTRSMYLDQTRIVLDYSAVRSP
jgi:hypothetical protein